MNVTERYKKIRNRSFIQPSFAPLLSFTLAKILFTLGCTIHPVKKHCMLYLNAKDMKS